MNTIIIASKNTHKVREIKQMLGGVPFVVKSLLDFPNYESPEETGTTFLENALIKARALFDFFAKHNAELITNTYVLADDSGLSCDALDSGPGVFSARFAGPNASDTDNNKKLVTSFENNPAWNRSAHYTCAMVLLLPDGSKKEIEEYCHGHIQTTAKGNNGFGYDPYFFLTEYQKTMAEISPEEKNKISHRGKALKQLLYYMKNLAKQT